MRTLPNLQSLRFPMPVAGRPLLLLLALFLLSGIVGHDPWKTEDAANFGIVWRTLANGDWLSFRFVTDRIVEPPLYYWASKLLALSFSGWLPAPDAARLATPLFAAAGCAFLYLAARELYDREAAAAAPLALVGSIGFLVASHDTQPMIAAVAGLAMAYAGLALLVRRPFAGAFALGAGWATLTLAHGLTLLPAALITALAACAFASDRRRMLTGTLAALAIAAFLIAPWCLLLAQTDPEALTAWTNAELGLIAKSSTRLDNLFVEAKMMAWFAWPALPLAGWAVWNERRRLQNFAYALPLTAFMLMLANVTVVYGPRQLPMLATLPSLAILATPGVTGLRRGAANGFDWFGRMTFTFTAGVVWLGWVAMNFGVPPRIAHNAVKLAPGFTAHLDLAAALAGAAATIVWLWLVLATSREPLRCLARWTAGITLLWLLATLLWLPWIDYGKSYRTVADAIARVAPQQDECVGARGLGEAHYASLDYFLGHRLRNLDRDTARCRYLVTLNNPAAPAPAAEWRKLWEGARPGDKSERIRVYLHRDAGGRP